MRSLIAAVLAVFLWSEAAAAACPSNPRLDELAGAYDFTTVVLGANNPKAKGVNGYYRMAIEVKGCAVKVGIGKYGFSGKIFSSDKIQWGVFEGKPYTVTDGNTPDPSPAILVDAELEANHGSSLSVGFTFVGRQGFWRYVGASWDSAGMWGGLVMRKLDKADAPFAMPKPLKCSVERVGGSTAIAVAFNCGDLIIARPTLDRATWHLAHDGEWGPYGFNGKIAASGRDNGGWLDYCYWARGDEKGATRLQLGAVPHTGEAARRSVVACGGRPSSPSPEKGRWNGGVR